MEIIVAAVATCVAAIGYLQWKRRKRSGRFIDDREAAYKEVWQSLEEIHLFVRSIDFEPSAFDDKVGDADTLLIRQACTSGGRQSAAASYITALRNLGNLRLKS